MGLPRPTTDLDQLKADLDGHGYCIVADALSPDEVTALRTRITEQAAAERVRALDYHYQAEAEGDDVNQWVYQLINKGEEFQNLALHPTARALATHILGAEHILSSLDAHITHPGNKTMPLHADQWWIGDFAPDLPLSLASREVQINAVCENELDWTSKSNWSFVDGRVLTAEFGSIYQSNEKNLLDPAVASATVMQGTSQ